MYRDGIQLKCLNFIISVSSYVIFKENSRCKYEEKDYNAINILSRIKENLKYYRITVMSSKDELANYKMFKAIVDKIDML